MKRLLVLTIAVSGLIAVALLYRSYQTSNVGKGGQVGDPIFAVSVRVLSAAEQVGEAIFNGNCAKCHGKNADRQDSVAPRLVHLIYEPNHHSNQSFYRAA